SSGQSSIAIEGALPEAVADHDGKSAELAHLGFAEGAARNSTRLQDVEEVVAHHGSDHEPRLRAVVIHRAALLHQTDAGKRARIGMKIMEIRIGREALLHFAVAAWIAGVDADYSVRKRNGERTQPERVNVAEEREIRANAERERQHRDRGESGRFAQDAQTVEKILNQHGTSFAERSGESQLRRATGHVY